MYMLVSVALEAVLGLGLALLLAERPYFRSLLQTVFLLPLMLPMVITGLIFVFMFNDQFGAVNQILQLLGAPYVSWLSRRWTAFGVAVMADVWMFTPYFMVLLYASLQSLPPEPLEAAEIDGATYWQKLRHVIFPLIYPVMLVAIVIRLFDTFRAFDIIWTVTKGGPGTSTEVLSIYAYKKAFTNLQFDLGAATGIIGALFSVLVGVLFFRTFQRSIAGRYEGM
jgi:multiple sugar transport system permease protein